MKLLTKQEFLDKVFNINSSYKERFSYDEFEYKGRRIKSKIKCNSCGNSFQILPWNHIRTAQNEKEKKSYVEAVKFAIKKLEKLVGI